MSAHRFFLTAPLVAGAREVRLPLDAADQHHAVTVLRVRPGETVEAVDAASGVVWSVRVTEASAAVGVVGEVIAETAPDRRARALVTLVQGVAKGEKMDAIVRQATEIGAARIVPVLTSRCVVRLDPTKGEARAERWRRVARSAAEQSHRDAVPYVDSPRPLTAALEALAGYDVVLVPWEDATDTSIGAALAAEQLPPEPQVAVVIGPEGGLSAEEIEQLEAIGARAVTLGRTILRTETAAVVALALTIHALGGLGASGA